MTPSLADPFRTPHPSRDLSPRIFPQLSLGRLCSFVVVDKPNRWKARGRF